MLARIYEELGDAEKAINNYELFLALWKNADAGIAEIEDAKTRLRQLTTL